MNLEIIIYDPKLYRRLKYRIQRSFTCKYWLIYKQAWTAAWIKDLVPNIKPSVNNLYILFPESVAV